MKNKAITICCMGLLYGTPTTGLLKTNKGKRKMNNRNSLIVTSVLTLASLAGCGSLSDGTNAALFGAGIGALAGQAIGGDTEATLIGTGVGAAAGGIIGNEMEHQARRERSSWQRREIERIENGLTTRRSNTRRVLNPDGTYTIVGEEITTSEETTGGYTGLPNN